ncbi:ATP-binding protein [Clostridium sp. MB40-C1]|uniref:PAS domain-containing sensor histidine kinase n=1 Tax=Clostridium sp. MB40-C1 TaxID=3070996 RepID=UPI0027E0112C|nr:ATP-binding protein [Clostridium sp. MB40-C1]WMJ79943.1 ATP-binding protein [Clostridium sp. MB40-C1]
MNLFFRIILIIFSSYFIVDNFKAYKHIKSQNKKLNLNENLLDCILNSTGDGILVVSLEDKILHFNNNFLNLWNLSKDFPLNKYKSNELMDIVFAQLKYPIKFKKDIELTSKENKEIKQIVLFKDNRIIEQYSRPLIVDSDIIGRVWSFKDITKETNANNLIEKSAQQYKKLIEFLPAGILIHIKGNILFCNTEFCNLLSVNNQNFLVGKNILDFVHKDYIDIVTNRINEVQVESKTPKPVEEKLVTIDGKIIEVNVSTCPYMYEGKMASLVVFQDITEHKQAEALRKKVEEKQRLLEQAKKYSELESQFFSNLSHEFRTPLNVLYSCLQLTSSLLENSNESELGQVVVKLNGYTSSMKNNCFRLMKMVNNLIDITKIKSGYLKVYFKNDNIVNLVENIVLSSSEYIEQSGLSLIFDTDTEEKIMACDSYFIERILLNLLSNSTKFTTKGGKILVTLYDKSKYIVISVKDTGIGISKENHSIIFEPFTQIDKSLTRKREGSGVGLYIVKSLVHLLGGEINIKSHLGSGSEFIIQLPSFLLSNPTMNLETRLDYGNIDTVNNVKIEFSDIY